VASETATLIHLFAWFGYYLARNFSAPRWRSIKPEACSNRAASMECYQPRHGRRTATLSCCPAMHWPQPSSRFLLTNSCSAQSVLIFSSSSCAYHLKVGNGAFLRTPGGLIATEHRDTPVAILITRAAPPGLLAWHCGAGLQGSVRRTPGGLCRYRYRSVLQTAQPAAKLAQAGH